MLIQPTERAEHDRRVNNMSIRKVVAGLLITAGIAIMAVPFLLYRKLRRRRILITSLPANLASS